MGGLWATLVREPTTPIKGCGPRFTNCFKNNFRGLIGFFIPLFVLPWLANKENPHLIVQCIWMWIFWTLLFQPVNIPVAGLIPIFAFPMTGIMNSDVTTNCYFNDNVALFVLGGWLAMLLNNSGYDRRLALWILCRGKSSTCTAKGLIIKSSIAAFILSMISNRLIVTSNLIEYVTPTLMTPQGIVKSEPEPVVTRCIINNAIHTSAAIGSTAIIHASFATLAFRAIYTENLLVPADTFNYLQYTAFALPTALGMFVLNVAYHILLENIKGEKNISLSRKTDMKNGLRKHMNALPSKITTHELLTIMFTIIVFAMYFFRWSSWFSGWSQIVIEGENMINDATVSALFVTLLHVIPNNFGFLDYATANKKSQLPPLKAESAVLWWRFIDKNTCYGYIFLIGSGIALNKAIKESGLNTILADNAIGKLLNSHNPIIILLLICIITCLLVNMMSSVAGLVVFLPFVLNMGGGDEWKEKMFLGALGIGIGSSLGFMWPFLYTPAYFCHYIGKVPKLTMAKNSLGSVIICMLVLWLALCFYAPIIFSNATIEETTTAEPTTEAGII